MIELDLVRKHVQRLLEASVTVKSHTRHSKKGTAYRVQQHERQLSWSGKLTGHGHLTAIHPNGSFTISKAEDGFRLSHKGIEIGVHDTVGQAKASAEMYAVDPNYQLKPIPADSPEELRRKLGVRSPRMLDRENPKKESEYRATLNRKFAK